jgi:DNA polymerase-3 subunit alpha
MASVARVLEGAAGAARPGPIRFCLIGDGLPGEVELSAGRDYPVTPQIKGAIKSLDGVMDVQDI